MVRPWVDELPDRDAAAAARFGVRPEGELLGGATSVVVLCDSGVLKLSPDPRIAADEALALAAWGACDHVVDLLDHDENGALLLARLRPGRPVTATGAPRACPVSTPNGCGPGSTPRSR